MTSPKARRRQRSTRLTVAVVLVTAAAALVLGALVLQSSLVLAAAAVTAVALGAAATRITHAELMQARRDANQDRAAQAQAYRALAAERADENADVTRPWSAESSSARPPCASWRRPWSARSVGPPRPPASATRRPAVPTSPSRRARASPSRLEDAEERAAEAIVHLAELEQEADVLRSGARRLADLRTDRLLRRAPQARLHVESGRMAPRVPGE